MNKIKKTIFYLKKYPFLSTIIFCFILFGSFLEIFSLGMLIPVLKGVLNSNDIFEGLPILNRFKILFNNLDKVNTISVLVVSIFILAVIKDLIFYLCNISISKQRFLLTRDIQLNFFHHLIKCEQRFFDSMKSGHLLNSLYNESIKIGNYINCILRLSAGGVKLIAYIFILAVISWQFTIITGVVLLIILIPIQKIIKQAQKIGVWINKAVANFNFTVLESLNGIRVIKMSGTESYEEDKFENVANSLYKSNYMSLRYIQAIEPLMQVMFLGLFVISFITILQNRKIEVINIMPFVLTYLYIVSRIMSEAKTFNAFRAESANYLGAFDSYEKLLSAAKIATLKEGNVKINKFRKQIDFNDVYFSYDKDIQILKGMTFSIPEGKTTAIVGLSGAGKTTLISLMLRFYDVTKGSITVDGIDLRNLDLNSWRRKIGFVSQDVFIFNTTVRNNICYGHFNASEEEIVMAAQAAEIHEFIEELPKGYNTVFGERGVKLSGGQKQRLSIARAIIHNPEILLLDEATSSLDTKTERLIQKAIDELARNRTVMTIAHRLSSVMSADNIIVIDKGTIIEQGCHEVLLKKGGYYAELYKFQFEGKKK